MKLQSLLRFMIALLAFFFVTTSQAQTEKITPNKNLSKLFPFVKTNHTQTSWFMEMNAAKPNVRKAERDFINYFLDHPKESSKQRKIFLRWLSIAKLSMDKEGYFIPYRENISARLMHSNSLNSRSSGTWRMIGPNFAEQTTCGTSSSLSGGFCDRVYINPKNTNNLFAGFSYGGLWVSQDQGQSWDLKDSDFSNGTNRYANRDYYYGDIEASADDSSLIFAATEAGLLKSVDFGSSWIVCPQLNRTANTNLRPYFLSLHTTNSQIALCTFGRELYRSTDAGMTWTMVFDNSTGGSNHYYTNQYTDNSAFGIYDRTYNFFGIEADYNEPNVFYLGVWNNSEEPCIYKSIDGGASFNFLINLNTLTGRTLPDNLLFQTIPAQANGFYIYPQFTNADSLYHFDDNGILLSRTKVGAEVEAADIDWLNPSNMYTGFYFASSVMKSVDGGLTFVDQTSGYAGCPKYVHPDVRGIDVVGNLVLIGSDGGLAISTDAMNTVHTIGREISAIDLWGFSSSPKSDIVSAGCDHGPTKIRRFDGNNGWISRGGGDAAQTSVNQSNDKWVYYNHGYGIYKTELDSVGTFLSNVPINPDISLHKTEFHPNLYFTAFGIHGNTVKVSRDNFTSFNLFYDFGQPIDAFKIAAHDTAFMYVLLSNSEIKKSTDGGISWNSITPSSAVSNGQTNITDITLGNDPLEIWAAYGNFQNSAKVLKSIDGGLSWTNITSANLPLTPVTQIVYQRGTMGGVYIAFAGQSGVWYRNDSLAQWEALGSGLPMIGYLTNIYSVPAKGKYRMGTSRGAWEHDLYEESMHPVANFASDINSSNCTHSPISFYQNSSHSSGPATYQWSFQGGTPSSATGDHVQVTYSTPGYYDVSLTVTDEFGNSNTKTLQQFISVFPSICSAHTTAGVMLDLPSNATNSFSLSTMNITGNEFTITAWVKVDGLQKSFSQIIGSENPNTRFGLGFAFMGYTPNTNLIFTHDSVSYAITSNLDLDTNSWHHIALTYSSTEVRIYVDGNTPWITTGNFGLVNFSNSNIHINNDIHGQGGDFHGKIDELCFYNVALSQEEIREKIHLIKVPSQEVNLVGYYQFNQYDQANSLLYEVINGTATFVPSNLVNTSPIPVASGVFDRVPFVTIGSNLFNNSGVQIDYPIGSTAPNGEMVVSRLNAYPFGVPSITDSIFNNYWVIRNWGNQSPGAVSLLSFSDLGYVLPNSLFTREANAQGNTWGNSLGNPDSITSTNNITAYYGSSASITSFGQFCLGYSSITDIKDNELDESIQLFPNPTTGLLSIKFDKKQEDFSVQILEVTGRQVGNYEFWNEELINIDLSSIASGIYFIQINT
ncbi:MAG: PKD domain-containing protein, partial [Bacteroidia bacterium]|nr:PKD domain-containing protein [Bacteroidia bacterium]